MIEQLALEVGNALQTRQLKVVTAESCTGGWLAQAITTIPGSSAWFEQGFIPYSNVAKQSMLDVKTASLRAFGAVSREVALEMAAGALLHSQAHCSLAITGIAGPAGGSIEKPVGTVWFAWGYRKFFGEDTAFDVQCQSLYGDRQAIRLQATQFALTWMLRHVSDIQV